MNEDPKRLRSTANTCRRRLGTINDPETVFPLTELVDECEAKLRVIADRQDNLKSPEE